MYKTVRRIGIKRKNCEVKFKKHTEDQIKAKIVTRSRVIFGFGLISFVYSFTFTDLYS